MTAMGIGIDPPRSGSAASIPILLLRSMILISGSSETST